MKRISLILIAVFTIFTGALSQSVDEALRYSQIFYGGTARFMSMGGAFTALGGDLSSLSQNPAGLGVYRSSEITITPQLFHINTAASFDGITSDYLYKYNLSQAGIVSNIISNSNETGLITLNIGYSFNKTNMLDQSIRMQGAGTSSMADFWAANSNGTLHGDLIDVEDMAYQTYLIDPIAGSGGLKYGTVFSNYTGAANSIYGQNVERILKTSGYTGEHALSVGGNYSNKLFFGATLGINKLRYTSHLTHLESANQALLSEFKDFTYTDHFENTGTGYALKMGAIFKPVEILRIGVAFHSPTFYRIEETFYETLLSHFTNGGRHEFSVDQQRYHYTLTTPFRALVGAAVQIKKFALISADYEYVDYSIAKFADVSSEPFDYSKKNSVIKNTLQSTNNIRLGGEFRLNKLYLRTGYGYYGKAFRPGEDNSNLDYSSLSFGAGFREQNMSIDFAYTNYNYSQKYFLYPLDDTFDPASANLSTLRNMFTVTFGYKFGY